MKEPQTKRDYLDRINEMLMDTDDIVKIVFIYRLLDKTREPQEQGA